jgi:hypothetical protein
MLCKFCANFNLDAMISLAGYQHHASYVDLLAAATSGCILCEAVRVEHEGTGNNMRTDDRDVSEASGSITCSLGLVSSRLQWEWQSGGQSMVVAMTVSSVPGKIAYPVTPLNANISRQYFGTGY